MKEEKNQGAKLWTVSISDKPITAIVETAVEKSDRLQRPVTLQVKPVEQEENNHNF